MICEIIAENVALRFIGVILRDVDGDVMQFAL